MQSSLSAVDSPSAVARASSGDERALLPLGDQATQAEPCLSPVRWAGAEAQTQTEALLAYAEAAAHRSPFEAWRDRLDDEALALLRAGGPDAAVSFLLREHRWLCAPIDEALVALFTGLVERWGWDPHRPLADAEVDGLSDSQFEIYHPKTHTGDTFLEWLCAHPAEPGSLLGDGLAWPTSLPAFLQFTHEHGRARNQAWLIALAVASGANPWMHEPSSMQRSALAFQYCCLHGHWDTAIQLLRLPGAPSLRDALDQPLVRGRQAPGPFSTVVLRPSRTDENTMLFETGLLRLLTFFPECRLSLAEAQRIPLCALSHLAADGRLLETDKTHLLNRLDEVVSKTGCSRFRPFYHAEIHAALTDAPRDGPPGSMLARYARFTVRHVMDHLSTPLLFDVVPRQLDGLEMPWLATRVSVEGVPPDSWTVLDLYLLNTLVGNCHTKPRGLRAFPWRTWVGAQSGAAVDAPPEQRFLGKRGALKPSVGGDPISRGVWCLALLGQQPNKESPEATGKAQFDRIASKGLWTEGLEDAAFLFDISDWACFALDHSEDALAATEWVLDRAASFWRPKHIRDKLAIAWAMAFERFPQWLVDRPSLMVRLLRLLGPSLPVFYSRGDGNERVPDGSSTLNGLVVRHLNQHPFWSFDQFVAENSFHSDPERVAVVVEQALAFSASFNEVLPALAGWVDSKRLPEETCQRLRRWCDTDALERVSFPDSYIHVLPTHLAMLKQALMGACLAPEGDLAARGRL